MKLAPVVLLLLMGTALLPSNAQSQASGPPPSKPRSVYVTDFALDPSIVQTATDAPSQVMGSGGVLARLRARASGVRQTDSTDPEVEARQAVNQLSDSIVDGLVRAGVPAVRVPPETPVPADCWILRGEIDKLSEGNRAQQSVIGFGAGNPEVEVSGYIDEMQSGAPVTILTFGDQNKQHHMPGGIVSRNPYVIVAKFVLSRNATGRDVQQLGESIASKIVDYMRGNGLAR